MQLLWLSLSWTARARSGGCALANRGLLRLRWRRIRLKDGRLSFHDGLRLIFFLFNNGLGSNLGQSRRIEFRAKMHDQAAFLIRFGSDDRFVLRIIEELLELLESEFGKIKIRVFGLHPLFEFLRRGALLEFHAMGFQDVPQLRQSFFRPRGYLFGSGTTAAFDDIASARTAYIDEVCFLQLFNEVGEAARSISTFAKSGIQLQHGALEQAELRLHGTTLQHLQSAFDQRHRLAEIQRRRPGTAFPLLLSVGSLLSVLSVLPVLSLPALGHGRRNDAGAVFQQ